MKFIQNKPTGAVFDRSKKYRYSLWRWWAPMSSAPVLSKMVAFIGLNPSTADATKNDPTVTRCINFARHWNYDGMVMLNLFAYRATDPKVMKAQSNPIGAHNNLAIFDIAQQAGLVVCCWGTHGTWKDRGIQVADILANLRLYHWGLTQTGQPKHPLYLRADTPLTRWTD